MDFGDIIEESRTTPTIVGSWSSNRAGVTSEIVEDPGSFVDNASTFWENLWNAISSNNDGDQIEELRSYFENLLKTYGAEAEADRIFNSNEAQLQRSWASKENAVNRSWQTHMANTSYSRAVQDLKNAGLNPILALSSGFGGAQSGNSVATSGGSAASHSTNSGESFSTMMNAMNGMINGVANTGASVSKILSVVLRFMKYLK